MCVRFLCSRGYGGKMRENSAEENSPQEVEKRRRRVRTRSMAASRVGARGAGGNMLLLKRYRFFFYVSVILISIQLFLAWNFYSFNEEELNRLHRVEKKLEEIERERKVCLIMMMVLSVERVPFIFRHLRFQSKNVNPRQLFSKPQRTFQSGLASTCRSGHHSVCWLCTSEIFSKCSFQKFQSSKSPPDDSQLPAQNGIGAAEGYKLVKMPEKHESASRREHNDTHKDSVGEKNPAKSRDDSRKKQLRQAILKDLGWEVSEGFDFERECDSKYNKETESALVRASTDQCQKEIMMTACLDMNNMLYPKRLPRYCPLQGEDKHCSFPRISYFCIFADSIRTKLWSPGSPPLVQFTRAPLTLVAILHNTGLHVEAPMCSILHEVALQITGGTKSFWAQTAWIILCEVYSCWNQENDCKTGVWFSPPPQDKWDTPPPK